MFNYNTYLYVYLNISMYKFTPIIQCVTDDNRRVVYTNEGYITQSVKPLNLYRTISEKEETSGMELKKSGIH